MTYLIGGAIAWVLIVAGGMWTAAHNAPIIDEPRYVQTEDILITPHGVEIPVAWLEHPDDLDSIIETLAEIDALGTGATA